MPRQADAWRGGSARGAERVAGGQAAGSRGSLAHAANASASARAGPRRAPRARPAPGTPIDDRARGHVARHDRAGGDERLLADLDARAQHRRRRRPGTRAAASRPRSGVVRRRGAPSSSRWSSCTPGPDEHVVLDDRARGQVDVGLDRARARRSRRRCRSRVPRPITRAARRSARARARTTGRRRSRPRRAARRRTRSPARRRPRPAPSTSGARRARAARSSGAASFGGLPSTARSWISQPSPITVPGWIDDVGAEADALAELARRRRGAGPAPRSDGCTLLPPRRVEPRLEPLEHAHHAQARVRRPRAARGPRGRTRRSARTRSAAARGWGSRGLQMSPERVMYSP